LNGRIDVTSLLCIQFVHFVQRGNMTSAVKIHSPKAHLDG